MTNAGLAHSLDHEQARIVEVLAHEVVIPYDTPRRFGSHTLTVGEHLYVKVVLDNGLVGYGEAVSRPYIYGESLSSIRSAIGAWFGPTMIGRSPFAAASLWKQWRGIAANYAAKAALDMAMTDLQAQLLGIPVWSMLGGEEAEIPLTWILLYGDPAAVVDEARARAEDGYRWFKVKVSGDHTKDVRLLARLSEALPGDCRFYGDANQGLSGGALLARLRDFREHGLAMIEDPLPSHDIEGRRRLRDTSPIPIIADECVKSVDDCAQEIALGGSDLISVKIFRTGFSGSATITTVATAFGRKIVVGGQGETFLGACVAGHFASGLAGDTSGLPAELSTSSRLPFAPLRAGGTVAGGRLMLSRAPGFGIELDEDLLAANAAGQTGWRKLAS